MADNVRSAHIENIAELTAHLARAGGPDGPRPPFPHVVARDAVTVQAMARRLHRLYEANCNDHISNADYERRTSAAYARAVELMAPYGVSVEQQTDPRGWPLILRGLPDSIGDFRVCPY